MEKSAQELCQSLMYQVSKLTRDQLLEVCKFIDLPDYEALEAKEDNHQLLVRKVNRHLNRGEIDEMEDEGLDSFKEIQCFLKKLVPEPQPLVVKPQASESSTEPSPTTESKSATHPPQPASGEQPLILDAELALKKPILPITPHSLMTLARREFKISGQIGEPNQKDKLSFSSLAHQIENGRLKGHTEREIIEGVIRAISPGSPLRSYLEGRVALTLPSLRQVLRSHYREKDATELYQQLSRVTQDIKESPQSFLVRALDLKQKVIFASQEAGSGLKYDPTLVQSMFLHGLLTGLRSDAVKSELRPYLQNPGTTNEQLFEKINVAARQEAERQEKLGVTSAKQISVKVVQHQGSSREESGTNFKEQPRQGSLMTDLAELKAGIAEIATMKTQIAGLQQSLAQPSERQQWTPRTNRDTNRQRGCSNCQRSGTGDSCEHCYKCGSGEHFARGCRQWRRNQSGNGQGLLPRDGQ